MATKKPITGITTDVQDVANARAGQLQSARQTLGSTTQVVSIDIPSWARAARLYPNSTGLQYAIDEDPVTITAVGYSASITASSAYGVGAVAPAGSWTEVRFDDGKGGTTRPSTLRLLAATSSSTVDIIFHG